MKVLLAFQKTGILGSVNIEPFQCQHFILFERKEYNKTGRCLYLVSIQDFCLLRENKDTLLFHLQGTESMIPES